VLTIQRLNLDSSWYLKWASSQFLIDPWLVESEVDGFSWFNEQWHTYEPVSMDSLPAYDFILISQPYDDHCHIKTLQKLDEIPVVITERAVKRFRKYFPNRPLHILKNIMKEDCTSFNGLEFGFMTYHNKPASIYDILLIKNGSELIAYCPHGMVFTQDQLDLLKNFKVKLLITSFSYFRLPKLLGGAVNPGPENALELVQQLSPEKVMDAHDENKKAVGIVKKIAKTFYPTREWIRQQLSEKYIFPDPPYQEINV